MLKFDTKYEWIETHPA